MTTARAFARAALLGNPSDGYHGKTIALTLANFAATAEVTGCETVEIGLDGAGTARFASVEAFLAHTRERGCGGLVEAAVKRFAEHCAMERGFAIRCRSSIPRQVGLGGSSAIVTASLRALCSFHRVSIPPETLANLTLAAEREELGIAAGLQDRVAQAFEGLVYMDFDAEHMAAHGHGIYERLDPGLLPPLYVAYQRDPAEPSGAFHGSLRSRWERGDRAVVEAMAAVAELAARGRECLLRGDHSELARLIDANLDARRDLGALDPRHLRMVDAARSLGACANYAGSGGAIVGICRDAAMREALGRAFAREGCAVIEPIVA